MNVQQTVTDWSTGCGRESQQATWNLQLISYDREPKYPMTARFGFTKQFTVTIDVSNTDQPILAQLSCQVMTRQQKKNDTSEDRPHLMSDGWSDLMIDVHSLPLFTLRPVEEKSFKSKRTFQMDYKSNN